MNPASAQADPPVAWTVQQVVAQERPDVLEHARIARWMQPMAAIVDPHAGKVEAPGDATDDRVALEHNYIRQPSFAELIRGAQARWSRAQNYCARFVPRHAYTTRGMNR